MKTLKFALIAVFVALALVNQVNADDIKAKPTKKVVNLTIEQAVKIPGLVIEMYNQLDEKFLNNNQATYTKYVSHSGVIFRITGSFDQWRLFFRNKVLIVNEFRHFEIDQD